MAVQARTNDTYDAQVTEPRRRLRGEPRNHVPQGAQNRQVRLCRLSTAADDCGDGAPAQHGMWLPATLKNREMLRWFMEIGVSTDGPESHWIEERSSPEAHAASALGH